MYFIQNYCRSTYKIAWIISQTFKANTILYKLFRWGATTNLPDIDLLFSLSMMSATVGGGGSS